MSELEPAYRWRLPPPGPVDPELASAARELAVPERLLGILSARGVHTPTDLTAFFGPPLSALHDPRLLPHADAFRARLSVAASRSERVLVFGDFDADGLTGLAIMTLALRRLGLDASPYVPSRLEEGHGLSLRAVERAHSDGRTVIVTVDCGTSSVAEVEAAREIGIDVLVTDHHHPPSVLPPAAAIVNPHLAASRYPEPRLAGSGVALKLAQLVLAAQVGGPEFALGLADLAAIGTVADVAPVLGENRAIARLGLDSLRSACRPGLAALLRSAGVEPARVDLDTVAFAVAPRLNAVGRLGDAGAALRLLLEESEQEAERLGSELNEANLRRRELTAEVLDEARRDAEQMIDGPAVVVAGAWPVGIIGVVAGRLAETHNRPVVVLSTAVSPWRGSARTANGFDLAAAFADCRDLFERFGGHPAAAGCSLPGDRFEAFRQRFLALAAAAGPPDPRPELAVDIVVHANDLGYALHRELALLAPTGPGNPAPMVGVTGLVVTRVRQASGGHTQLTLRKGREVLDAICFDRPDLGDGVREGDELEVVARVGSRMFGGFESLQLEVRDAASPGALGRVLAASRRDAAVLAGATVP